MSNVYGNQVLLRLYNSARSFPLVVDFNSFEYKLNVKKSESFRTIGKTEDTNNVSYGGFTLTLRRIKTDNLLDNVIYEILRLAKHNNTFHELMVQKIVKHTYSVDEIDLSKYYKLETGDNSNDYTATDRFALEQQRKQNSFESEIKNIYRGAKNQVINSIDQTLNTNYGEDYRKLKEAGKKAYDAYNQALSMEDLDKLYKLPFREMQVFTNCTITDFSGSDVPNEVSEQSITLSSTGVQRFGDDNEFNDWVRNVLMGSVIRQFNIDDFYDYKNVIGNELKTKLWNEG